jgi:hypothetical protein
MILLLSCKILFTTLFLKGYEDCRSPLPMFQTGSGKSVLVSESLVQKARAVLEEEGDVNTKQSYLLYSMHMKLYSVDILLMQQLILYSQ